MTSYITLGKESLESSRQYKRYSDQFKLNAVELYLITEKSYQELAAEFEMNDPTRLASWLATFVTMELMVFLSRRDDRPK